MKKQTLEHSIAERVEAMIEKDETLLLNYTVDELIDMAANGKEIKMDGCTNQCPRFRREV